MTLSLNSNLSAVNSARTLGNHYSRLATSVQRLSSGLRVNSAADDAAGLAVRELMRADITSYRQGIRNANDAVSLIQTADGALSVIDEKLIRMKELAEQAATGTYNSTQRLIIDNEFQAMGAEIDRIARSTDFNGLKLLDGSLAGEHDGSGLNAAGAMKIHFGPGNDSAEDYYYIDIADCTLAGLGLAAEAPDVIRSAGGSTPLAGRIRFTDGSTVGINDFDGNLMVGQNWPHPGGIPPRTMQDTMWVDDWCWSCGAWSGFGYLHVIPAGTKNVMFNIMGPSAPITYLSDFSEDNLYEDKTDADIQLFTMDGKHLAGTPLTDVTYTIKNLWAQPQYMTGRLSEVSNIESYSPWLGFTENDYDDANLNSGPAAYDTGQMDNNSLNWTTYNGMRIGYSGDANLNNDGKTQATPEGYEVLVIDGEVTEDLLLWVPGGVDNIMFKQYWDGGPGRPEDWGRYKGIIATGAAGMPVSIAVQDEAQKTLDRIDAAVVKKDNVRAHLGALQNRFENTISNLQIQEENLQASESRISDMDVAVEMTNFVRNQILAQSAAAMLTQANSLPQMLAGLVGG